MGQRTQTQKNDGEKTLGFFFLRFPTMVKPNQEMVIYQNALGKKKIRN